ncbi:MAG TPA: hypothetical protein VFQ94_02475 [Gallionella sp.]|nr:hypothetical protein [Gallionella sp.]
METFSMDMSNYEIERGKAMASGYGDEVLCAGWIPGLACHQPHTEGTALSADLVRADVDALLRKMYACQR